MTSRTKAAIRPLLFGLAICFVSIVRFLLQDMEPALNEIRFLHNNTSSSPSTKAAVFHDSLTTNSTTDHYCQNMVENLPALRQLLQSNPNENGLRDLSVSSSGYYFPGLDVDLLRRAFFHRKIVLIGDSTLRQLMIWLDEVLFRVKNHDFGVNKTTTTLNEANDMFDQHKSMKRRRAFPFIDKASGTHIQWKGFHGHTDASACDMQPRWEFVKQFRPDILVVNMGLHWLQFQNLGRDILGCVVEQWVHYERFLAEALRIAQEAHVKLLLYKTTNFICEEKYIGAYAFATQLYSSMNETVIANCVASLRKETEIHNITSYDLDNYCRNGASIEAGSMYLNQRIIEFVDLHQNVTDVRIEIFNDHDIDNCLYTTEGDGRHYFELNLVRIRMLANMLSCMFGED